MRFTSVPVATGLPDDTQCADDFADLVGGLVDDIVLLRREVHDLRLALVDRPVARGSSAR